jgi:hypothetical protein
MASEAAGWQFENKHGVKVTKFSAGWCFDGPTVQVPDCCLNCHKFDYGEFGEYGTQLGPPFCTSNIWFPVRSGTCKAQQPIKQE